MNITLIVAISLVALFVLVIFAGVIWYIQTGFHTIDLSIRQSVLPHSLTISPSTQEITDLAIELWRLEKRLSKIQDKISDTESKALQNSTQKLKRYIQQNDIEINDYTGQAYNDGMNLDILSSEKDPDLKQSIIFETHEPAITHKGILIRKAKVIIHEK